MDREDGEAKAREVAQGGVDAKYHVLLVAFASQGHINPMLKLGKRLASKGLHVTLATTETARHRMVKANITTTATTTNNPIHLEFFSDGLPIDFDRLNKMDHFFDQLEQHGPTNLSNLIESLSNCNGSKFSCIINNPFVPWVADVAQDHGIPCAMLWIQPCALYAIYYRYYNGLNQFPTIAYPNMPVDLPGLPILCKEDLPSFVLPSNTFSSVSKTLTHLFGNMDKVKWVLGNSFYELEKDAVESMDKIQPIIPVGPLVSSMLLGEEDATDAGIDMWKADDSCIEWLDKQPLSSVVYVSFGSLVVLSSKQMENIAWGLKNSCRPFLWVVKPPEYSVMDRTGQLPLELLKEMDGQGLVVTWCPQTKVLSHPSVACFVTHCGWNSILETVASGVPVITYPQWTDQPTNAKLLVEVFEIGVRFKVGPDGVVGQDEVERCIADITEGPKAVGLKKKALYWKEAARAAVGVGGSSDRNIQVFVDDVIHRAREYMSHEVSTSQCPQGS
ncbi:UDP-glycosyltransferase 84B2-like [Magnolia sinica]|uniref:UDP-glycosyltransferase 84B2-like n=1 Tax=Magnolia sinica TaxID=86752 RepID=UPI002659FF0D|nr:UDP-glycosyltransferase 84B2-like [Magnolia sinica]